MSLFFAIVFALLSAVCSVMFGKALREGERMVALIFLVCAVIGLMFCGFSMLSLMAEHWLTVAGVN